MNILHQPKPFMKWVGGKRSILNEIWPRIPQKINNYFEPFVGGGALFFRLYSRVGSSHISDLNLDLMVAYSAIKHDVLKLIEQLKIHEKRHDREYFYKIRSKQSSDVAVINAARFIYLMATCFNGLYRVNSRGEFNSSLGKYRKPIICNEENLLKVSEVLQTTDIEYCDFRQIRPKKGDFVYFDPPYHGCFTQYLYPAFSAADHISLRDFALQLTKEGVNVMISNSENDFIYGLYNTKDFNILQVKTAQVVNCDIEKRKNRQELLITNY